MEGKIERISGPLVVAYLPKAKLYEVVYVGREELIGEVITKKGNLAYIQVYEDTTGLEVGEPVKTTGKPLSATLGPGLLQNIYDGLQRPLKIIGDFIKRGYKAEPLDTTKKWKFIPIKGEGDKVNPGEKIGYVEETSVIRHYILVPPNLPKELTIKEIQEGEFTVNDTIAVVQDKSGKEYEIKLSHTWPVRKARPFKKTLEPEEPIILNIRILDFLFPIVKGGSAAVPGGFGTGKTVLLHAISKVAEADIIIFIGCGERGNEMADALESLKKLIDPRTNKPLLERAILVANTSNMPVAARESSIFLGITLAEYYRDMGYNVILIADSISRWAEAVREISGRMGEMPGEEGYPAYLASRMASFYERARRVITLSGEEGSVTIINSVSPPGGDFSEPVTQTVTKFVRALWALDKELANKRHFPAINWNISYSFYGDLVAKWWIRNGFTKYLQLRELILSLLEEEGKLLEIARVVGPESLPKEGKLVLKVGRLIREGFLQQDMLDPIDMKSTPDKTYKIALLIEKFYKVGRKLLEEDRDINILDEILYKALKLRFLPKEEFEKEWNNLMKKLDEIVLQK